MTLTRLYIVNFAGACVVAWAWWSGFVTMITASDPFHVTYIIAAAFAAGVAFALWCGWQIDRIATAKDARKAAIKNMAVADIVESLSMLGLIGSALGLLYAFGSVSQESLGTADGIKEGAIHVLTGVKLLAGATLAGVGLALWTIWNNRILETATALRLEDLSGDPS